MLYPLKFKPILKQRIWGGDRLHTIMGKKLPVGKQIGESWEVSGIDGDVSIVSNGALKGNSLAELIEVYMGELVGDKVYDRFGLLFPVLIKLIDAQQVLSVQVHPNDDLAEKRHNSYGKTEMWYIIDARKDAQIFIGFEGEVSEQQYNNAIKNGTVAELLHREQAKIDNAFFIPAGTVHALGGGILLAEIQQTSDVTYRIDDWGRTDEKGNPRELHNDLAAGAIIFGKQPDFKIEYTPQPNHPALLKQTPYFTVNILKVSGVVKRDYFDLDSFVIYILTKGSITISHNSGIEAMQQGDTILIPASIDNIELQGEGTILEVYIGDNS